MIPPQPAGSHAAARLLVIDPSGNRTELPIDPLPFTIGRHPENKLVIRDSRASRNHARIVAEGGELVLEDAGSRHGTLVNGAAVRRHPLRDSDRIEFGFPDSYQMIFHAGRPESARPDLLDASASMPGSGNLARLRALLEMARALENSGSTQDVLVSLVDAALAVAGAERGFLLLKRDGDLEIRVARDHHGASLPEDALQIPRTVIRRALERRRELLSMSFDPGAPEFADRSVAALDLRSVVCLPLVRVRSLDTESTSLVSAASDTMGVLYMDSRLGAADLSAGNRELLQSLAIDASIILENARLLEEERAKRRIEEELDLARTIQQSLLPREFPSSGWLRAAGSSLACHQVGGDYFDVSRIDDDTWAAVVADVSGKGVGPALLASLLQGAFAVATASASISEIFSRLNRFLSERTEGEKYATMFYGRLDRQGVLSYVNAGHCPPLAVLPGAALRPLPATTFPVGILASAEFAVERLELPPGAKLILYTDGVTEARDPAGTFFGSRGLKDVAIAHAEAGCVELHGAIRDAVRAFTQDTPQADDITLAVIEYAGPAAG